MSYSAQEAGSKVAVLYCAFLPVGDIISCRQSWVWAVRLFTPMKFCSKFRRRGNEGGKQMRDLPVWSHFWLLCLGHKLINFWPANRGKWLHTCKSLISMPPPSCKQKLCLLHFCTVLPSKQRKMAPCTLSNPSFPGLPHPLASEMWRPVSWEGDILLCPAHTTRISPSY